MTKQQKTALNMAKFIQKQYETSANKINEREHWGEAAPFEKPHKKKGKRFQTTEYDITVEKKRG
ncbi:Rop family plasmid primer RNA-binding protein, partial [Klebsiella pneumoniae]|uniref:Rop family plasmid primer RNA-binding protein n=1 Tax=Klebsiella pneumoniae TaxID=573 RepID=UPI001F4B8719